MIFIDTEFNRKNELLSLGFVDKNNNLNEFYIKNDPRDKSYKTHGLSFDFLNQNGVNFSELKSIIESFKNEILVGFDIEKDLIALNLKPYKMFSSKKIIDLKLIFSIFTKSPSLETIILSTDIFEKHKSILPIHTSSMDSFFLKESFYHLFHFLLKEGFSEPEIISDFKEISSLKYFNEETRTESIMYDFQKKYDIINKYISTYNLSKKKIISLDLSKIHYSVSNESISLFDTNKILFAKLKKEHINISLLDKFNQIEFEEIYKNIGYKNFNLEEFSHGII